MESTRAREPISNTITSSLSSDNNSFSQNRSITPKLNSTLQDSNSNTTTGISTQQILIDEGTIDCLSLPSKTPLLPSRPNSFKNLNIYNDDKSGITPVRMLAGEEDEEEEDDEVDQLRIIEDEETETITPTIVTNKSLLSNGTATNHSSILDTLISSTNGPSVNMGTNPVISTPIPSMNATSASPSMFPHNFPYLSSTIANSPSKGGFLDRLFTFSPNGASSNVTHLVTALKTPNASYQDRVSLFTTSPQKIDVLSSPNESNQSNGFHSNLTNSLLSNDESPNFSNLWLNQNVKQVSSNDTLGKGAITTTTNITANMLPNSNVHNNILNRQPPTHAVNDNTRLMDTLYSNKIHSASPQSHQHRNHSLIHSSGIQKHTINQTELRRAREKTRNNLKHFLNESTLNGPILTNQNTKCTILTTSPTTNSSEEEFPIVNSNNTKLPSPESEVPLKQKLKMRSYKIL